MSKDSQLGTLRIYNLLALFTAVVTNVDIMQVHSILRFTSFVPWVHWADSEPWLNLQMDEMHQTARQAVTVTMRSVPQLRKLTRAAGGVRDRMGTHARLLMRRTALVGLMAASRQLLEDLDTFFSMVDGTMARTHGRRIESLLKVWPTCSRLCYLTR